MITILILWMFAALFVWAGIELLFMAWRAVLWICIAALSILIWIAETAIAPFAPRRPEPRTSE
ncbi:MAG: hypothetical protein KJZ84_23945 [Bryobacteraceae bacterium]|nr:hypothetical protein [Bryobacteraceae bacterium]